MFNWWKKRRERKQQINTGEARSVTESRPDALDLLQLQLFLNTTTGDRGDIIEGRVDDRSHHHHNHQTGQQY